MATSSAPDARAVPSREDTAADTVAAALTLARAFSSGATMWCVAPEWPPHGRHLAVEFVHPVIMGTRALPAISIDDIDPVPGLRSMVRPGDIVVAVGRRDAGTVAGLLRRAGTWGAVTVWIGAGDRPDPGAADHVLWADDPDGLAPFDGRLVRIYHLLWEMTHVCFEHPGLLNRPTEAGDETSVGASRIGDTCTGDACVTCSDEGILAEVVEAESDGDVLVRTARGAAVVDATLVGPVAAGDLVLVHAGTAISLVEPHR